MNLLSPCRAWLAACLLLPVLAVAQPAPTPSTNRPPLISSRFSAILATIPGLRHPRHVTNTPSVILDVAAAIVIAYLALTLTAATTKPRDNACLD